MQKQILVIDDDKDILEVIKIILEGEGFSIQTATDGRNLNGKLSENPPDAILLDYFLPGDDGGKIATKIKSKKDTKDIPIIMMSANHNASQVAKKVGVEGFLAKPFDIDDLLGALKDCMKN